MQMLSLKDRARTQALGIHTSNSPGLPDKQPIHRKISVKRCREQESLSQYLIVIVQQTAEKRLWCYSVWSDHSCTSQHVALNSEGTPGMPLITPQSSSDKTLHIFKLLNRECCISIAVWAEQSKCLQREIGQTLQRKHIQE